MKSKDLISMGLKNLFRRKTRTILTVLGVVIGTASIIVMLSLGIGMNKSFEDNLKAFGSLTTIDVNNEQYFDPANPPKDTGAKMDLDDKAVKLIEELDGVDAVLPMKREYGFAKIGKLFANLTFIGVDVEKLADFEMVPEKGALPVAGSADVLFGQSIQTQFMNPKLRNPYMSMSQIDLMASKVEIGFGDMYANDLRPVTAKIKVAGILPLSNNENDWSAFVDIKSLEKIKAEIKRKTKKQSASDPNTPVNPGIQREPVKKGYDALKVKVLEVDKVLSVQEAIKAMGFQAYSLADGLEYMKKTTAGIRAMLGGIGAVSLLVAALGITNTMVMSIYERTSEIGVMKVIGARLIDIKRLFLFEAALIGLLGGVIGVIVSYLVSIILNSTGASLLGNMYGSPDQAKSAISIIPLWLAGSSLIFSTVVGLLAGYYPAVKAMKLSALEAIRR